VARPESNPRPLDRKSDAITVTPPRQLMMVVVVVMMTKKLWIGLEPVTDGKNSADIE